MSTIMLPIGSWIGSPAPIAAAIGCSMRYVWAAPARRAASSTARCSTWVIADGTQIKHPGPVEPVHARALEQQADHALRDLEVGDRAAAQWPHRDDVARRAADHLPRLLTHREHVLRAAVERDDRRLVQDDAAPARVHEGVRGTEIDREVARQGAAPSTRPDRARGARYSGASARSPRSNSSMLCSIVDRSAVAHQHDHDADRAGGDGEQEESHDAPTTRLDPTDRMLFDGPVGAARPVLLLPDRNGLLEGVDAEPCRFERRRAMR